LPPYRSFEELTGKVKHILIVIKILGAQGRANPLLCNMGYQNKKNKKEERVYC
jgi:hypothetical protein